MTEITMSRPRRQISSERSYVLQRFGMRQPTYVNNIGTRVRDMEIRKIPGTTRAFP